MNLSYVVTAMGNRFISIYRAGLLRAVIFLNLILITFLSLYLNTRNDIKIPKGGSWTLGLNTSTEGTKLGKKFLSRGEYWVIPNLFVRTKPFHGNDSITLTTPTDVTHLDNIVLLTRSWEGPISCAVYTPGDDYFTAARVIHMLRECHPRVKERVSFHVYFQREHVPEGIFNFGEGNLTKHNNATTQYGKHRYNCSEGELEKIRNLNTFRTKNGLTFPINVARNIARERATTHFVLASDIELHPSANLIPMFLAMVRDPRRLPGNWSTKSAYILPLFELTKATLPIPRTKDEIVQLYNENRVMSFHKWVCEHCHRIPKMVSWFRDRGDRTEINIFFSTKRDGNWEPVYIGTRDEPEFDERLPWEGRKDKRIQNFVMCLLDYDYHILDNAFLIHRPGIKYRDQTLPRMEKEMEAKIIKVIRPEYTRLYGSRPECTV